MIISGPTEYDCFWASDPQGLVFHRVMDYDLRHLRQAYTVVNLRINTEAGNSWGRLSDPYCGRLPDPYWGRLGLFALGLFALGQTLRLISCHFYPALSAIKAFVAVAKSLRKFYTNEIFAILLSQYTFNSRHDAFAYKIENEIESFSH